MIYKNEASARRWAVELNKRLGHLPVHAVLTALGWTVVVRP